MVRPIRAAIPIVVATAVLAACTPQELGEFFADQDLRASENRAEAASGYAAEVTEKDRAAQELVDQGLKEKDHDKLIAARDLRPHDVRYPAYQAVLGLADGTNESFWNSLQPYASRYVDERRRATDKSIEEAYGQWVLVVMGVLDQAIEVERSRTPAEPARIERLQRQFCGAHRFYVLGSGSESREVLDVMFLGGGECESIEG